MSPVASMSWPPFLPMGKSMGNFPVAEPAPMAEDTGRGVGVATKPPLSRTLNSGFGMARTSAI